jgi:hypothetical protein
LPIFFLFLLRKLIGVSMLIDDRDVIDADNECGVRQSEPSRANPKKKKAHDSARNCGVGTTQHRRRDVISRGRTMTHT